MAHFSDTYLSTFHQMIDRHNTESKQNKTKTTTQKSMGFSTFG